MTGPKANRRWKGSCDQGVYGMVWNTPQFRCEAASGMVDVRTSVFLEVDLLLGKRCGIGNSVCWTLRCRGEWSIDTIVRVMALDGRLRPNLRIVLCVGVAIAAKLND